MTESNRIQALVPEAETLINRAQAVKVRFKNERDKPLLVEFAGTPKSGKSTCIEVVAHFFHRLDFKVFAPTEGVSKRTPRQLKDDLLYYNAWAACYALMQMFESRFHSDRFDIAIFDRGIFDVLAWIDWLCVSENRISEDERDRIHEYMTLDPWRNLMDLVLLFRANPGTSLRRENQDKLLEKEGRAMNPESLAQLNEAYDRVHMKYKEVFSEFLVVDTSERDSSDPEMSLREIARQICDLIIGIMEAE